MAADSDNAPTPHHEPEQSGLPGLVSGGPFVAMAVLCERVLREQDGVMSVIRIVDSVPPRRVYTTPWSSRVPLREGEARDATMHAEPDREIPGRQWPSGGSGSPVSACEWNTWREWPARPEVASP